MRSKAWTAAADISEKRLPNSVKRWSRNGTNTAWRQYSAGELLSTLHLVVCRSQQRGTGTSPESVASSAIIEKKELLGPWWLLHHRPQESKTTTFSNSHQWRKHGLIRALLLESHETGNWHCPWVVRLVNWLFGSWNRPRKLFGWGENLKAVSSTSEVERAAFSFRRNAVIQEKTNWHPKEENYKMKIYGRYRREKKGEHWGEKLLMNRKGMSICG